MTVKELIEKLQMLPQDAKVVGDTGEGDRYEVHNVSLTDDNKVLLDE